MAAPRLSRAAEGPQRTIIVMCDGLGLKYYDRSPMPSLKAWAAKGIYARAQAVMPTVTNCNNASICCGVWPAEHGVIGNSYFDQSTGTEEYMEDAKLVLAPTIFERARVHGVRSEGVYCGARGLGSAAGWPAVARAQQGMPVIGFLHHATAAANANRVAAFRQGLNEAGFIEPRNVTIEFRWAENQLDRLSESSSPPSQRINSANIPGASMIR